MGQKVNPHGLRVGVINGWNTQWYADKKEFSKFLKEDNVIRTFIKKKYYAAAISKILIERAAARLTSPGLGKEVGASLGVISSFYQGFFLAPTVTAGALKGAIFAANVYEKLGYGVVPNGSESRHDIIQAITFGTPEGVIEFCRGIQAAAPVDSFVVPEPWAMPGYDSEVIMAAGTFVQGSSIELSADGPLREPYTAFLQGGLTYESGKIGVLSAAEEALRIKGE